MPKGTPPEIVKTLREATVEVINSPQVVPRLELEGAEPVGNTPEEFAAFMKAESGPLGRLSSRRPGSVWTKSPCGELSRAGDI